MSFDKSCYRQPTVEDYSSEVSRVERSAPRDPFGRPSRRYSFSRPSKKSPPPIKTTSNASDSGYSSRSRATANSNGSASPKSPFKTSPQSPASSRSSSSKTPGEKATQVANATADAKSKNGPPSSYKHKLTKAPSGSRSPSKTTPQPTPQPTLSPQSRPAMYSHQYTDYAMAGRPQTRASTYGHPYSYSGASTTPITTPSSAQYGFSGYPPPTQPIPMRRSSQARPLSLDLGSAPQVDYFTHPEPLTAIPSSHWHHSYDSGNYYHPSQPAPDYRERRPTLPHLPTEYRDVSRRPRPTTMYEPQIQPLSRSRTVSTPRRESSRHRSKSKYREGRKKSRKYRDDHEDDSDYTSGSASDSDAYWSDAERRDSYRRSASAIPSRKSSQRPKLERRSTRDEAPERKPRTPAKITYPEPSSRPKSRAREQMMEPERRPSTSKALTKKETAVTRKSTKEEAKSRDREAKKKTSKTEQTAQEYQDRKVGRSIKKQTVTAPEAPAPVVEAGAKVMEAPRPSPTVIQPMRPPQSTTNNRRTSVDAPRGSLVEPKADSAYDDGDGEEEIKFSLDQRGNVCFSNLGTSSLSTAPGQNGLIEYTITKGNREQRYIKSNSTRSSGSFSQRMSAVDAERYRSDKATAIGRDRHPIAEEGS